ncbi:MAG: YeeE/YedE thiosulfate transporter family protein [Phycisphaerales bacterium]
MKRTHWSPYLVGALIGVLSWITFGTMHKALGVSTTPVRMVAGIERTLAPEASAHNAYITKYAGTVDEPKPIIEWQFALVAMLAPGAWIGARFFGKEQREPEYVPELWAKRFGSSRAIRYFGAIIGGAILMYGARMAGGCTSGHALSGGMQLSVSGWIFMAAFFITGVPTALFLYGNSSSKIGDES